MSEIRHINQNPFTLLCTVPIHEEAKGKVDCVDRHEHVKRYPQRSQTREQPAPAQRITGVLRINSSHFLTAIIASSFSHCVRK
jgi:hypothetical protein